MSKKKEIFSYIESYIGERGYSPSVREIGKAVGLQSTSTVAFHLRQLRKEKRIEYVEGVSRTITIRKEPKEGATKFDALVSQLQAQDGPLQDRTKMATFLAQVQLADTRDALEWLEYLSQLQEGGKRIDDI